MLDTQRWFPYTFCQKKRVFINSICFDYLDDYCFRFIDASICWAAAEADIRFAIFDLYALKERPLIKRPAEARCLELVSAHAETLRGPRPPGVMVKE